MHLNLYTFDRNILVSQRIPSPAHLIQRLLVRPRVAWLVLGSSPAVAAAGVCLRGRIASAGVGHCLGRLVLVCAVGKRTVRAFAVGVGEVSAGGGGGHGG